jgi:NADPH2:quinone reductase
MRALLSHKPGGPQTLKLAEVELPPTPAAGYVRIAVRACAVNYPDVLMIEDRYQVRPPRPFAPGLDIAGVVEAVGTGVSNIRPGDRVMAQVRWGGMAEMVDASAVRCAVIPDGLPFGEAAALLTTYGTARFALQDCARLKPGETVLVLGAAGGVGLAAVELAHVMGARVVAAASSPEKLAAATRCGADAGVVYPTGTLDVAAARGLAAQFKETCGPSGANVILDVVGGDYSEAALRAIAERGRMLIVGFAAGIPRLPMNLVLLKRASILGVAWSADLDAEPDWLRRQLDALIQMYAAGQIRPEIGARFPLERAAEAIAALAERRAIGKMVVEMRPREPG